MPEPDLPDLGEDNIRRTGFVGEGVTGAGTAGDAGTVDGAGAGGCAGAGMVVDAGTGAVDEEGTVDVPGTGMSVGVAGAATAKEEEFEEESELSEGSAGRDWEIRPPLGVKVAPRRRGGRIGR